MERQTVYCELEFLIRFVDERPIVKNPFEESEEIVLWKKYANLFLNDSDLFINESKETLIKLYNSNEFVKLILKNSTREIKCGQFEKLEKEPESFFDDINPHAVFFFNDATKCKEMEEDYGMMFISNETIIENAKFLFQEGLISISKKENHLKNWDFVSKYKHPCNSLIIVDNYILKDEKKIEKNLILLLKELLPTRLKKEFQLVIITDNNQTNIIKDRYEFLLKQLKSMDKPYKIVLKIITQAIDNHDRNLLTNYLWINSGCGFSIFNYDKDFRQLKIAANTHFSLYAVASKASVRSVIKSLKEQYIKIEKNGINGPNRIVVMPETESGKITSRLLK